MASSRNEKEVKTNYPYVEGLTAGTTKQTGDKFLVTRARKSFVGQNDSTGMGG